jgi:hypothetical protein
MCLVFKDYVWCTETEGDLTGRDILLIFRISLRVSARHLVIPVLLFCVDE